jgi:dihydroflavonol-4-reductase
MASEVSLPCRPRVAFWQGRRVGVTGGGGFLGYQLVCQLRALGAEVRLLSLPPPASHPLWRRQDVTCYWGDVRDAALVRRALAGCEIVFHTAAVIAFAGPARAQMAAVSQLGTQHVLAALDRGARLVHTSSVVTVGASRQPQPVCEETPFPTELLALDYVRSKRRAETLVLAAAGEKDVVIVNPTFLLGPEDYGPSDLGRWWLRFWKGRAPVALPGGINLVDVRDAACGHLLAAEWGRPGRRYLLGGEDRTFVALGRELAAVARLRPRAFLRLPVCLLGPVAAAATCLAWCSGKTPFPSFQHARLGRYYWFARSTRACQELGYQPRPLADSLRDTYHWFRQRYDLRPRPLNAWWLRPELEEPPARAA